MLAIQTTAPRKRRRAAPDHVVSCHLCGARYDRLRTGIGGAGEHASALIAAAGRAGATGEAGDGSHVTLATARRDLGAVTIATSGHAYGADAIVSVDCRHTLLLSINREAHLRAAGLAVAAELQAEAAKPKAKKPGKKGGRS